MNLPYFISKRISGESQGTFSQSINKVATVSIAVGIASLLLSFTILGGFQDKISEKIFSFSGHLNVTKYTLSTSFEENALKVTDSVIMVLDQQDYVTKYQSIAYKAGLLKANNEVQGVIFKGVDSSFDTAFFKQNIVTGKFPDFNKQGYSLEVTLSRKISDYLNVSTGDDVLIFFVQNPPRYRKLKVSAIYETGLEDFDEKIIFGDLDLVRRLNDWDQNEVGGIEVFIKNPDNILEAQTLLFDNLPIDYYVENVVEKYLQIFDWLELLNRNVAILLVLILFVSSFSMISIVLILILERTQMIGMLKAMGSPDKLIRKIFFTLGVRLILKGLFWGNLVGLGVAVIQYYFKVIPLDQVNYYMSYVPVKFDWFIIVGLNLITAIVISLSLYIPVVIISKISPIKSIRFD